MNIGLMASVLECYVDDQKIEREIPSDESYDDIRFFERVAVILRRYQEANKR